MTDVSFKCSTCGVARSAPAEAVTLVLGPLPRYVVVCGVCGTTRDEFACPAAVRLIRDYVRVVVPVHVDTTELTPEAVLALVEEIRSLPEVPR